MRAAPYNRCSTLDQTPHPRPRRVTGRCGSPRGAAVALDIEESGNRREHSVGLFLEHSWRGEPVDGERFTDDSRSPVTSMRRRARVTRPVPG